MKTITPSRSKHQNSEVEFRRNENGKAKIADNDAYFCSQESVIAKPWRINRSMDQATLKFDVKPSAVSGLLDAIKPLQSSNKAYSEIGSPSTVGLRPVIHMTETKAHDVFFDTRVICPIRLYEYEKE